MHQSQVSDECWAVVGPPGRALPRAKSQIQALDRPQSPLHDQAPAGGMITQGRQALPSSDFDDLIAVT